MTKKGEKIQTHFESLTVTVREYGGRHLWSDSAITEGAKYTVLATYLHKFVDKGNVVPAFLIEADGGEVRSVACERCTVVKEKVQSAQAWRCESEQMTTWHHIVNQDEGSELKVGWGLDRVYANLEMSGTNFPIHLTGEGPTAQDAVGDLHRLLNTKGENTDDR